MPRSAGTGAAVAAACEHVTKVVVADGPRQIVYEGQVYLQGALAGWVYRHGAWPWLVVLIGLLLAVGAWARLGRRRARGRPEI